MACVEENSLSGARKKRGIRRKVCPILVGLVLALPHRAGFALNEPTHEIINEHAASVSKVDLVMKEQLGLPEGILTRFNGNRALQWIRLGGTLEDAGTPGGNVTGRNRYFRHFHDPLLPWDRSGLLYILTLPPRLTRFESSVHWAQLENQDSISGFGNFSWRDARRYFKTALTDPDATLRERAFADAFRAMGQLMHLIVDASVPEHVRGDVHPMGAALDQLGAVGNYEYWVLAQHRRSGTQPGFIRDFLSTPVELDERVLRIPILDSELVARVPIARLFDSDRYTGENPEATAEARIGIAEIANANFFSEDTHRGEYPHPLLGNLEQYTGIYSKTGEERVYFRKRGAGLPVDPIATECALAEPTGIVGLCPDNDVWRETGRHMLPRAVRYSREVLDYFFRGTLDFTIGRSSPNQTLTITNKSDEAMEGTFTLYADNFSDTRTLVAGASFNLTLGPGATSGTLDFTPPAEVQAYTLVFQGKLGLEEGAVAGKVNEWYAVTDVSPSTITPGQSITLNISIKSNFTLQPRTLVAALFDGRAGKLASREVLILNNGPTTTQIALDVPSTAISTDPGIIPRPISLIVATAGDIGSITVADLSNQTPVGPVNLVRVGEASRLPIYQRPLTGGRMFVSSSRGGAISFVKQFDTRPFTVTWKFKNAAVIDVFVQPLTADGDFLDGKTGELHFSGTQPEFSTFTISFAELGERSNAMSFLAIDASLNDGFVCILDVVRDGESQLLSGNNHGGFSFRECPE